MASSLFIDAEPLVRAPNAGTRMVQTGVDGTPRSQGWSVPASPAVIANILVEMGRLAPELWRARLPAGPRRGQ